MIAEPTEAINSMHRLESHESVLRRKPELQQVFRDIHTRMLDLEARSGRSVEGVRLELGSGVYPLQRTDPAVLSTEVVPGAAVDLVMDAERMPFPARSVRTLFLQNVFHHFGNPSVFFSEASRVLRPGGLVIMLEPFGSNLGRVLYPRLFKTETYDPRMLGWRSPSTGPMSGANQALSQIVFARDRQLFTRAFPTLEIAAEEIDPSWLRYLASGGLNFPRLLPRSAFRFARHVEHRLDRVAPLLALHHYVVLRRNESGERSA